MSNQVATVENTADEIADDQKVGHAVHDVRQSIFALGQMIADPELEPLVVNEFAAISNSYDDLGNILKYFRIARAAL
jgi:hypothetical protein